MATHHRACAVALGATISFLGCGGQGGKAVQTETSRTSALYLSAGQAVWPGPPAAIPVCFENLQDTPDEAKYRGWAQNAVERNWQRFARINFTGWGQCAPWTSDAQGIRILIGSGSRTNFDPNHDPALYGYQEVNGVQDGMTLDLYDEDSTACQADDTTREICVRTMTVHEFGHALGFRHSEADQDPSDQCMDYDPNQGGSERFGAYTSYSVMSACWFNCWGSPTAATCPQDLLPMDIAGVQEVYGRRTAGEIVSAEGQCMTNTVGNGNQAYVWPCDNGQAYDFGPTMYGLQFQSGALQGCVDLQGGNTTDGTPIQSWDCLGNSNQYWGFQNVMIRGYGGLCLDLPNSDTTNGSTVDVWECGASGSGGQLWSIDNNANIHFGPTSSSKCLTYDASMGDTSPLFIWDCGYSNQVFAFNSSSDGNDGSIQITYGGQTKCVDVRDVSDADFRAGYGGPADGEVVQTYDCLSEQLNQKWFFSGPIQWDGSTSCIDDPGASDVAGTGLQIWGCNGWVNQQWDYYPLY